MMRSKRKRPKSFLRWLAENPFLCLALLSLAIFGAMALGLESTTGFVLAWNTLGIGFHLAAATVSRILPGLSGWLEISLTGVLGLLPYVLADAAWQRIKPL